MLFDRLDILQGRPVVETEPSNLLLGFTDRRVLCRLYDNTRMVGKDYVKLMHTYGRERKIPDFK